MFIYYVPLNELELCIPATLVAAAATACSASPKIRTTDGNIHLDVDAGADVVFRQMGGYSHSLGELAARTNAAVLRADADAAARGVAGSLDDIRDQATTDRATVTANNASTTRQLAALSANITAALRGPNSAIAALATRIESLEVSANNFSPASLGSIRVNVSRRMPSGSFTSFTRHKCTYTGGNPVNNQCKSTATPNSRRLPSPVPVRPPADHSTPNRLAVGGLRRQAHPVVKQPLHPQRLLLWCTGAQPWVRDDPFLDEPVGLGRRV